jgi:hypothetical protein
MRLITLLGMGLSLSVAACTSLETSLKSVPVPMNRMFGDQKPGADAAQLTIIRDRSIAGSICYYAILIDDKLVARIANSEKATFALEAGGHKLQITRDKLGEGLCSSGDDETTQRITLEPKEKRFYRLSQNMAGSPNLRLLDIPADIAGK